jgi:hypothetical protein
MMDQRKVISKKGRGLEEKRQWEGGVGAHLEMHLREYLRVCYLKQR